MIRFVEETGSTNADLAAALRADEELVEGDWLAARRQTAGRGRQGRTWFDGMGNFMGSTVVHLREEDPPPATLSFVAALAVAQAVEVTLDGAATPRLKWPNDVSIDGGKVSGILLEMVGKSVVIGIGVNLERAPELPDRKTVALSQYKSKVHLLVFAEVLERFFAQHLAGWRREGLPPILNAFLDRSEQTQGASLTVHDTDGSRLMGTFAGLEETDGALRLRLADGSERVIRAGDIS